MGPVASRHRITALAAALCAVAAPIALGACSSSSSSAGEKCPATVNATVTAHDTFRFTPSSLNVKAGKVVVKLVDGGSLNHTFQIRGFDGKAEVSSSQKTSCATFTLTKGSWTYYCGIPGHETAGMKGTITVS
ncbi:MAG TPA: plastocyanin/azurin family copper-binding protein [Acidimicrobiia bacterium]|jgi:plastocyanin